MGKVKQTVKAAGNAVVKEVKAAMGDRQMQELKKWQQRLEDSKNAAQPDLATMEWREELYLGTREIQPGANSKKRKSTKEATTVRNFVSELIEAQIDPTVPDPKVDAVHKEDELLAIEIEQMLRMDKNRLPVLVLNDEQERTVPMQGGSYVLVEWDNDIRTHLTTGDSNIQHLHPKQVYLQRGCKFVLGSWYAIMQFSVTPEYIKKRYDVDVSDQKEANPEIGVATSKDISSTTDNVTFNLALYRNEQHGIGAFGWVNDIVVVDYEDYLARRIKVCKECGRDKSADVCECGSKKFREEVRETEVLLEDVKLPNGKIIPKNTEIPYYKIKRLPLILRKNVSIYGKLLGESDVDRIADLQERSKKLETNIDEKLLTGGSILTLFRNTNLPLHDGQFKVVRVDNPTEANCIQAVNLQPNIANDTVEAERCHTNAKQILGITDSWQGLPDKTATSGVAKQFAAMQTAGRLESKRVMKSAFWADVYQLLFEMKLAFADEPRPFMVKDFKGNKTYGEFSRYHFLKQDAAGKWYYEDNFLFDTDNSGSLASNRQAMWQECRANYQMGAFGEVGTPESLMLYWMMMETLHYPKATEMRLIAEKLYQDQLKLQEKIAEVQIEQAKAAQVVGQAMQGAQQAQQTPPRRGVAPSQLAKPARSIQALRAGNAAPQAPVQQQSRGGVGQ